MRTAARTSAGGRRCVSALAAAIAATCWVVVAAGCRDRNEASVSRVVEDAAPEPRAADDKPAGDSADGVVRGKPTSSPRRVEIARLPSDYEDVRVFEANGYRCIGFGEPPAVQTCVHKENRLDFQFDYLSMMVAAATLVENDAPRVLVLGLGGAALPRLLRLVYPQAEIDAVELDPAVVQAAREYLYYEPDPKTTVIIADAAKHAARAATTGDKYDLIFVDCYDSESIPGPLRDLDFLRSLRSALAEGGLVVANLWEEHPSAAEMRKAYAAAFEERWLMPGTPTSGSELLIARPVERDAGASILRQRRDERAMRHRSLDLASHLGRLRRLE